jgi:class 3 adenylate cyclase
MTAHPQTHFTTSGKVRIAYQTVGDGPFDLVHVAHEGLLLDVVWEQPVIARALRRLGSFSRVVLFAHRGTGASDPLPTGQPLALEERIEDVRAVLDAIGSKRAALFASSDGGPMSILFAATHPGRVSALILYGTFARMAWASDYRCGVSSEHYERVLGFMHAHWGDGSTLATLAPSLASDENWRRWWARHERLGYSRAVAMALFRTAWETDSIPILSSLQVPTLVLHRTGDRWIPVGHGRFLAEHVPGAHYVELAGDDHLFYAGDAGALLDEIEEFLTGVRQGPEPDRVLATVLFTDIVGSTELAARIGDRGWNEILRRHHDIVRDQLGRFRGVEIDTAGDGFLATFDGPGRAIRCAEQIIDGLDRVGLSIRAGVHTGECELVEGKLGGIAVHIGARVAGLAAPGELLVSSTVKDLVAGSGIAFADRGVHTLKGLPDHWHLFAVTH